MDLTDINKGLTAEQAEQRVKNGLSNSGFDVKTKSHAQIVCENVFTLFNLINLILAVMVLSVGSLRNALFMGVVICNTAIGIFQEIRAKNTIDKLSVLSAPKARVIRDGSEKAVSTSDIVMDDIMILSSGNQVCADALVLEGECETDESLITGESDLISKMPGSELYSGSFVTSGYVKAQAVRVGAESASGRITGGSKYIKKPASEMMRSINSIIKAVSFVIVPFGLILLFKSIVIVKQPIDESITSATAALIGMIPEGLVLLTGIALAVSAIRLSQHNTLCQDLYCVESLARVDTLCLDKTGTLTEGCMEVAEIKYVEKKKTEHPANSTICFDAGSALSMFASAFPDKNATLKAIAERFPEKNEQSRPKLVKTVPFSSARKWSAAEFDGIGTLVLGAPELLTERDNTQAINECELCSQKGFRTLVLALSPLPLPTKPGTLPEQLSPKVLIVLSDKLRASAPATLEYFKKQGVTIKIISGDNPAAVSGIAERAGLDGAAEYVDMSTVSDDAVPAAAERYSVFGRTTPDQKLALIKALKAAGHKTAMTGDGVNDVLALREADCSIAMQSGSDAVRAVSQIVLLNSDFSSMPLVVEEGRRCINNIRRSAALFLTKTIFSFLLTVLYLFLPLNYPFKPIQLTLISAVIIGIPSFLLAMEPNKNRVSGSFLSHIVKRSAAGGISAALGVGFLTVAEALWKIPTEQVSTMSVILVAVSFFGTLFHVCRPFNKTRGIMFTALVALFSAAALLFPKMFYLTELTVGQLLVLISVTAASLVIQILLRHVLNNFKKIKNKER